MQWKSCTTWFVVLLALIGLEGLAHAQNGQPRRYVTFDVDPDYKKVLENRFRSEEQLGPLKDLVKKILSDPSKMPARPEDLKGIKFEDENFKKALKDWVNSDKQLQKSLNDWMKHQDKNKQPPDLKKFQDDLQNLLRQQKADDQPKQVELINDPGKGQADVPKKAEANPLERAMKQAENTRLGDWLRESPAWQQAFTDLRASIKAEDLTRWRDWQDKLQLPDGKGWKLGEDTFNRLRDLPRPNLENWRMPGLGRYVNAERRRTGMPNLTTRDVPSIGMAATWLLMALGVLLIGWQLVRWNQRRAVGAAQGKASVGPWPVQPDAVATRADLILAFDYLAIRSLGADAKSWNHRAVGIRWRERAPVLESTSHVLESLYEEARYTEGDEALSDVQREQACQSLAQLAGAL